MVTRTGFEPVYACVKGMCVKPLHQRAFSQDDFLILTHSTTYVKSFFVFYFLVLCRFLELLNNIIL